MLGGECSVTKAEVAMRVERVEIEKGALVPRPAGAGEPPIRPPKIVAIGLNYLDHIRETGLDVPSRPLVFTKFTTSVIGDGEEIVIDRELSDRVDWEVELAVVIGRRMSRVSSR